jgi:hypothetical protein
MYWRTEEGEHASSPSAMPLRSAQTVSVPVQSLADALKRLRVQMQYKDTDMDRREVTHVPSVRVGSSTITVGDASEAAMRSAKFPRAQASGRWQPPAGARSTS